MKKMICWACLLMALALLPALATAEGAAGVDASAPAIDWTALVVDVYKRQGLRMEAREGMRGMGPRRGRCV